MKFTPTKSYPIDSNSLPLPSLTFMGLPPSFVRFCNTRISSLVNKNSPGIEIFLRHERSPGGDWGYTQLKCSIGRWNQNQNEFHIYLNQRFQPCQLKTGKSQERHIRSHERRGCQPLEGPGTCSPVQNFKICASRMPFSCLLRSQSIEILRPTLSQAHCRMPKGLKNAWGTEKRQRSMLKKWLNREMEEFQKPGEY